MEKTSKLATVGVAIKRSNAASGATPKRIKRSHRVPTDNSEKDVPMYAPGEPNMPDFSTSDGEPSGSTDNQSGSSPWESFKKRLLDDLAHSDGPQVSDWT